MTQTESVSIKAALLRLFNLQEMPPSSGQPPAVIAPRCLTCKDRGYVRTGAPVGDPLFGQLVLCSAPGCPAAAAAGRVRYEALCKKSGVPGKYRDFTFNTFQALGPDMREGKMLGATAAYLWAEGKPYTLTDAAKIAGRDVDMGKDVRAWLVLSGTHGLGKTGLAAAALNHMARNGREALYVRLAEAFSGIQSRYGQDSGVSSDDVLTALQVVDTLILDECNVPQATPDKQRIFEEIIRFRHARELPTLLTTNLSADEFRAMWGDRSTDVLLEACHFVKMGGKKIRHQSQTVESF